MPLNQVAGGGGRAKEEKSRRSTAEVQKQMTCNTCADVPIAVVLGCRRGDRVCEDCGGPWRTGGFVEGDEGDEGDDGDDGDGESGSESSGISVHLLGEDGEVLGGVSGWYEEELASADDSGDSDYVPSESSRGPSIKDGFDFSLSDKDRLTSADDSGDSDFVPSLSSRCSSLESGFGLLLADEERVPFDLPSDDDSEDLDFVPSLRSRRSSRASGSTVSDTDEGSEVGSPSTMSARSLQDEPRSRTPEIPPRENESISTFDLGSALSSSSNPAAEGDSRRSYASCNSESEASNPFAGSRKASDSTAADSSAGSVGAGSMVRNGESGVSGGSVSWLDLEPGVSSGGTVGLEVAGVEGGSDWDWETTPSSSGSAARAGRELLRRRM
ncbi:hypothetical protein MMC30_005700 [Trapelia coarctata]|nr:hypothetical protein [Trapelia coarctata]